jgi:hypothetical protein
MQGTIPDSFGNLTAMQYVFNPERIADVILSCVLHVGLAVVYFACVTPVSCFCALRVSSARNNVSDCVFVDPNGRAVAASCIVM